MGILYSNMTPEQKEKANLRGKRWKLKNKEKVATYRKIHYYNNQEKYLNIERERNYKELYGITIANYDKIFLEQDGKCAICGTDKYIPIETDKKFKHFAVDHCHKTGKIRGLLCLSCNNLLGKYERVKDKFHEYLTKNQ